ncbi:MAG: alpha/beta hydrolase [Actinomycetia bacterium]|nr:alpha/beta hydrolase [Actinomycetes bacterium]
MPYATVNGAKLWYELFGSGEPMVLLGGGGLGRFNLHPLLPYLQEHFEILSLDQRGYGKSDPVGAGSMRVETWADDVPALLDAVGWEKAHMNSTALGGMVALAAGIRYPDRCLSITAQGFFSKPDAARRLLLEGLADHCRCAGLSRGFSAVLATVALSPEHLEAHPEAIGEMTAMMQTTSLETWLAAYEAMREVDLGKGLPTCHVPTLIIAGELDEATPLDMTASGIGTRKTGDLLPDARLVIFEGSGHVTIFERTKEHAEAIIDFVASLGDRSG